MTEREKEVVERFREQLRGMDWYREGDIIDAVQALRLTLCSDACRLAILDAVCERFPFISQRFIRAVLRAI